MSLSEQVAELEKENVRLNKANKKLEAEIQIGLNIIKLYEGMMESVKVFEKLIKKENNG